MFTKLKEFAVANETLLKKAAVITGIAVVGILVGAVIATAVTFEYADDNGEYVDGYIEEVTA